MTSPRFGAVSLRTRMVLAMTFVLGLVLIASGIAVHVIFVAQSHRNVDQVLQARIQLARQLAAHNIAPQRLVDRVSTSNIQVSLVLTDDSRFGADLSPAPPGWQVRRAVLTGNGRLSQARLVVAADPAPVDAAARLLSRIMAVAFGLALLIGVLLALLAARVALRPLAEMAAAAGAISGGRRGIRLGPSRGDTEVGRTATAFDAMLDELEGAEARARAAEAQAQGSAARMRDFLADAAHELRTPMAGVQAGAEALLHAPVDLEPDQRDRLHVLMITEARRAAALVEDLLDMARIDSGLQLERGPVSLTSLVHDEAERLSVVQPEVEIRCVGNDSELVADRRRVSQIVRNLLDNAARAAAPRGWVQVGLSARDGLVIMDVLDSGAGVPAADRERIFDRLVRGTEQAGSDRGPTAGAGLGLSVARGLARAHGGDLVCLDPWSQGAPGGALFRLTLPSAAVSSTGARDFGH